MPLTMWLTAKMDFRCLKSCQDVGVACRSDLCNSLLFGTIYLAQQSSIQQMHEVIISCLDSFLSGNIHQESTQFTADLTVKADASSEQQLVPAAAATAGNDTASDDSSQASGTTANSDIIDEYLKPPSMHRHWQPLMVVVGVAALPKGALVEVQPEACTVEAMTHLGSSQGSSSDDDDDQEERGRNQAQHEQARRSDWAAQLVNQESSLHGVSSGCCSCLTSHNVYLCCQVVFDVESGNLENCLECVVDTLSDRLAEVGMTPQHVASCTVYSHISTCVSANKLLRCFQRHWLQKHACELLVLHVPVWLLMTGVGTKLEQLPEPYTCMKLTAHVL